MAEGVDNAADAPAMFVSDGKNFFRAGLDCSRKSRVWIGDCQDDSGRDATQRFGTVVMVLWRFIAKPELSATNRESSHYAVVIPYSKNLDGLEGGLVEVDRPRTAANAKPGCDCGLERSFSFVFSRFGGLLF